MALKKQIDPVTTGFLIFGVKMLCSSLDGPFTERTTCRAKMYDPFNKELFQSRRKKLLSCMSLVAWLMDIKEARTKSGVSNFEMSGHSLDVNLAAILFLECKLPTTLFEKFFCFCCMLLS